MSKAAARAGPGECGDHGGPVGAGVDGGGSGADGGCAAHQRGTVIFQSAFDRWAEQPERSSLADRIHATAAGLAANIQPAGPAGQP